MKINHRRKNPKRHVNRSPSNGCRNNGTCNWCRNNRTYKVRKAMLDD